MDPKTLQLVLFAESMAALAAKTIADLRGLLSGASGKTADDILTDADNTYAGIIAAAKTPPPETP